jgi:hypothetical protein
MSINGDLIDTLNTDDSPYNQQLANILFKDENKSTINNIAKEFKESIIIIILFFIFSSTQVDDLIMRVAPYTSNNRIVFLSIKCILIIILFYISKNFHLSRK